MFVGLLVGAIVPGALVVGSDRAGALDGLPVGAFDGAFGTGTLFGAAVPGALVGRVFDGEFVIGAFVGDFVEGA